MCQIKNYSDLSIIIPVINERDNLVRLLDALKSLYPGAVIFVADDGSGDGTFEFMEKYASAPGSGVCYLERSRNLIIN